MVFSTVHLEPQQGSTNVERNGTNIRFDFVGDFEIVALPDQSPEGWEMDNLHNQEISICIFPHLPGNKGSPNEC